MTKRLQSVKQPRGHTDVAIDMRKLRRLRLAAGLSVSELARRAGCSKGYVSMLEHGDRKQPEAGKLAALAKALKCKIIDLMPDEPRAADEREPNGGEAA